MIRTSRLKLLPVSLLMALVLMLGGISALAQDEDQANQAKKLYNDGIKAAQEGQPDLAIVAYEGAIGLDPEFIDAYLNLGAIYFEQKKYDEALEMFRTAVDKDDQNVDAWANIGRVESVLKRTVEAQSAYESALAIEPANGQLLKELGKVLYSRSQFPDAVDKFTKCHEAGDGDHVSYYMLAKAYQKQSKLADAIAALKKSIEIKSKYYNSHSSLGSIYLSQEKYRSAAAEFKAALAAAPKRGYRAAYNYAIAMETADQDNIDANVANWNAYIKIAKNIPKDKDNVEIARKHVDELKERKAALANEL
ncbi:MAG: tetratricopeptide repeat protein [bacterium]|nr:tetratricopeptide repeat protein [bacterium]